MTPNAQQREYIITEEDIRILEDTFGVNLIIPRGRPHTPAPEQPHIMIEGVDGEMLDFLADDKEIYLDSFARFAKNPAVDMLIQMFRDKQEFLRQQAASQQQEQHP